MDGIEVIELFPSYYEMAENIAMCEASIDASALVLDQMTQALHRSTTPRGLTLSGMDGERNGRLSWTPGL